MAKRKAFLVNPKNKNRVEHDCSAHNKKSGDYYEYPSLSHLIDEH